MADIHHFKDIIFNALIDSTAFPSAQQMKHSTLSRLSELMALAVARGDINYQSIADWLRNLELQQQGLVSDLFFAEIPAYGVQAFGHLLYGGSLGRTDLLELYLFSFIDTLQQINRDAGGHT